MLSATGKVMAPAHDEVLLAALAYADLRVRWGVVRARAHGLDPDDEFRGLYIADAHVDTLLDTELGQNLWAHPDGQKPDRDAWLAAIGQARAQWAARDGSRLSSLRRIFHLGDAEIDVFLLALLPEIDPRYERLFAYLQDDVTKKRPTVDLLLNLLTDSFHEKIRLRKLFADDGHLLRARLLVRFADSGTVEPPLLQQAVRPAPRVVDHLLGHDGVDADLAGCATLLQPDGLHPAGVLPPAFAPRLRSAAGDTPTPLFTFTGRYGVGKREAARHVAHTLQSPLIILNLQTMPTPIAEHIALAIRDAHLLDAALYLAHWEAILQEGRPPPQVLDRLLAYPGVVMIGSEVAWQRPHRQHPRPVYGLRFSLPDYKTRHRLWQEQLADETLDTRTLANQFRFTPGQIRDAVAAARDLARWQEEPLAESHLFAASRTLSNQNLAMLATKIEPHFGWDDIVLPEDTLAQLKEMVNTVRQRPIVYHRWGFGEKLSLGKGLNALFAGESGTGKTMAADIMAGELGLDLYKIDLSGVVSKYIGETEKNLNRIFEEAETSNAILFFDEADALFGKRSEVKDSHDRYANIEISYLLQRMEAFDGVVILATNLRANLDEAFTRRLHFVVDFPFPEADDRERIWQVNVPPDTPLAPTVDWHELAHRFRLSGGNIRNVILAAAFLAADADEPVSMAHLLHATRREFQKMGRLINEEMFRL